MAGKNPFISDQAEVSDEDSFSCSSSEGYKGDEDDTGSLSSFVDDLPPVPYSDDEFLAYQMSVKEIQLHKPFSNNPAEEVLSDGSDALDEFDSENTYEKGSFVVSDNSILSEHSDEEPDKQVGPLKRKMDDIQDETVSKRTRAWVAKSQETNKKRYKRIQPVSSSSEENE